MNLGEMEQELQLIVQDSSLETYFRQWVNDAIAEIAADFDLPALRLLTPYSLTVTTATWLYALPDAYHKGLWRCLDSDDNPVRVLRSQDELESVAYDYEHDDTGEHVTHVAAIDGGETQYVGVYPLADDVLRLWYYEKPTVLADATEVCTCIPTAFHARVIIPKVALKNFWLLQDMAVDAPHQSLLYWEEQYRAGLFGTNRGDIGLLNYLAKVNLGGSRRHGGRDPLP